VAEIDGRTAWRRSK
jgi:hypothetical protein